jgi:hypoxanthine phosphoribosyltransferase
MIIRDKQIQKKIKKLAKRLDKSINHFETPPVFVCVLNGAYLFFSDLTKNIESDIYVDFIKVESYNNNKQSSNLAILSDIKTNIANKDVFIIDDISDSGNTFLELIEIFKKRNPRSISTISLLTRCGSKYHPTHTLFYLEDPKFRAGYGLDDNGLKRNINFIYEL